MRRPALVLAAILPTLAPAAEPDPGLAAARAALGPDAALEAPEPGLVLAGVPGTPPEDVRRAMDLVRGFVAARHRDLFKSLRFPHPATVLIGRGDDLLAAGRKLGVNPDGTSLGLYDPASRVLLCDLRFGEGNVTHETLHMLLHADTGFRKDGYAGFPLWLNEGLGGFFEGRIALAAQGPDGTEIPVADGRHQYLLTAFRKQGRWKGRPPWEGTLPDRLPPLTIAWLVSLPDAAFHASYTDSGNLGMGLARELLLYLQDRKALVAFHARFREGWASLPEGKRTPKRLGELAAQALEKVLGKPLAGIEKDLVAWSVARPEETALDFLEPLPAD